MRKRILGLFNRFERSIAWAVFTLSLLAFVSIAAGIWKVENKLETALIAFTILWQGFTAVQQAEDDSTDQTPSPETDSGFQASDVAT